MSNSNTEKKMETSVPEKEKKLTVLIVDKKEARSFLEKNIIRLGHKVIGAEDYNDAMKKISRSKCNLIIMDIDLPYWDGEEIIKTIKEMVEDINIVTMTENNNREREQRIRNHRVLYYAVKPVEFSEISSILDHLSNKGKAA